MKAVGCHAIIVQITLTDNCDALYTNPGRKLAVFLPAFHFRFNTGEYSDSPAVFTALIR